MGRILKKGTRGSVTSYISRSKALRTLQINLRDFRRLCIIKGIYPRDPPRTTKKKLQHGSTAAATWYFRSDISHLMHDPLLSKLRETKALSRKVSRYVNKKDWSTAQALDCNRELALPIDHIIRERYPVFEDALGDLDDALSLLNLFAVIPKPGSLYKPEFLASCAARVREFNLYLVKSRTLRYAFISVKGIYLQAVLQGTPVTWVVPHAISHAVPRDVDFRIMLSFLQLYETLTGFALFRLYRLAELPYPPSTADLDLLSSSRGSSITSSDAGPSTTNGGAEAEENGVLSGLQTYDELCASAFTPQLFANRVFFLARETNVGILALLVRSMGGRVLTSCMGGSGGGAAAAAGGDVDFEADASVTHHVIDRPIKGIEHFDALRKAHPQRVFVQPQWVFDCLNARRLLLISGTVHGFGYAPGDKLPPHLSPFVDKTDKYTYHPETMDDMAAALAAEVQDAREAGIEVEDEDEEDDQTDGAAGNRKKSTAAAARVPLKAAPGGRKQNRKGGMASSELEKSARLESNDKRRMAEMMMGKKQRKLYDALRKKEHRQVSTIRKYSARKEDHQRKRKFGAVSQ